MTIDRYAVNDALSALASRFGVTLDDDTLNELTHHVADILEPPQIVEERGTCKRCLRSIEKLGGVWIDPEATGDDGIWRETCDANNETVQAEHEPA